MEDLGDMDDMERPLVLAFGGNALLPDPEDRADETRMADEFARALSLVLPQKAGTCLVHGNGPQVGMILLRIEAARSRVPPETLDVLVAETEGSIGYILSRALRNRLDGREVAAVLTQVVVDPEDPGFERPEKPVGPYYPVDVAEALQHRRGWKMAYIPDRGWRRTVPSPRPLEVVEIHTLADAVGHGHIVIAGGGGGIPVARGEDGRIRGVEAVVDKDLTASLLAVSLDAERLIILTDVAGVSRGFGTPSEEPIGEMNVSLAEELLSSGEFPPGSMGPKVGACISYVKATGRRALITDIPHLDSALLGGAGTWVVP